MLVLTRRIGERLMIGDDVEVIILDVNYGQVRIGFNAPPETEIHREEIYRKIQAEKIQNRASTIKKPQPRQTLARARR